MNPSAAVFAPRAQQPKPEEKWWDEHMDQLLRGPTSLNSSLPSFESPPSDRICFTVLCGTSDPGSPLHSLRRHLICIIINHVVTARVHEHITETGQGISRTECTVDGMFHPGRALATAYQGDDWGTLCVEKWWGCCQQVNEMDGRDFTNAIGCQQQVGYWGPLGLRAEGEFYTVEVHIRKTRQGMREKDAIQDRGGYLVHRVGWDLSKCTEQGKFHPGTSSWGFRWNCCQRDGDFDNRGNYQGCQSQATYSGPLGQALSAQLRW